MPEIVVGKRCHSEYILQDSDKSFCSECGETVSLLAHKDFKEKKPAFFICFNCKTIGEVGVGRVKNVEVC